MKNIHQLITETVPLFFFTYNAETHEIEYVSPQFYNCVYNKEELDGLNPHDKLKSVIHKDDRQKFQQFFDDLSKKNKYESSVEVRTKVEISQIEWFEINTFKPTKYPSPGKTIVGHIVDITEKKKQYEILKQENKSIEDVMNMMAHDLKAPFAKVNLSVSIIEELMTKEEVKKLEKYLDILKETSKDAEKLIEKLLNLATLKGETSKLDLDLHDVRYSIKEVIAEMNIKIEEKNINISYSFPDYSVEALLDAELFKQVIHNLLSNAIKFTPDHGNISFALAYSDDKIELSVKDDGIGIPEEHLDDLFNGISNIKRKGLKGEKSTGLGLYICKQIVTIHNGNISAKRNNKKGSTFSIQLPVPEASAAYY